MKKPLKLHCKGCGTDFEYVDLFPSDANMTKEEVIADIVAIIEGCGDTHAMVQFAEMTSETFHHLQALGLDKTTAVALAQQSRMVSAILRDRMKRVLEEKEKNSKQAEKN